MSKKQKQDILHSTSLMVYLKQNEHANLDSLPLRFGFYFPENKVLELFNCKEQKLLNKESQIDPEYRLIASFKDINNEEHDATFILLDDNKNYPIVKTLWINNFYAEDKLSEYLKSLRKKGDINTKFLIDLHPYYKSGKANTVEGFMSTLAELNSLKDAEITDLSEKINNLKNEVKEIKEKLIKKNPEEIKSIKPERISLYEYQDKYPEIGRIGNKVTKIYGPPGTGKTTTLINLVDEKIKSGIRTNEIGFFSFTNFSIKVAKNRILKAYPASNLEEDFTGFRTLHSIAYKTLKTNLNILDKEQARSFDEDFIIEEKYLQEDDISSLVIRSKHHVFDAAAVARAKMISFREHLQNLLPGDAYFLNKWLEYPSRDCDRPVYRDDFEIIIRYNELFEEYKKSINVIDYTSIIEKALEQEKSIPEFKVIFVDEAQDFSKLEWTFAEKLFRKADHIYMAGDDDQAISETTGASAKFFVDYKFDEEIILNQSHRIPPKIHENLFRESGILSILSKFNPFRKEKKWNAKTASFEGDFLLIHTTDLLDLITKYPKKEWLIMSARNATIRKFSTLLLSKNQSHFLSNKIMPDNNYGDDMKPSINLATIWGAKGGEADCTVLIRDEYADEKMMQRDPRLEYVAQTRAKFIHFEVSEKYQFKSTINESVFDNLKDIKISRRELKEKDDLVATIGSPQNSEVPENENNASTSKIDEEKIQVFSSSEIQSIKRELLVINEEPFNGEKHKHNVSKLIEVRFCKRGSYEGVELLMEDGSVRAKIFGNIGKTFEIASKIKGLRIYTDVANPRKNSEYEWFKNIYIED